MVCRKAAGKSVSGAEPLGCPKSGAYRLTTLDGMGSNIGLFVVLVDRGRVPQMNGRIWSAETEAEKRG
ncbi:hypothetical protein HMPREF9440_00030 [Sutterella parvirubra YIT 11816]|uniref:Uncharacterized protein n=1 Tax=Sutterella parvirubra YIT 11816 TaxID=762967 RepID=H3KBD5_9BURK|nr:hypothetical protein HMPREF9440_00030 [Sutterella parvirubra YIT 11816]